MNKTLEISDIDFALLEQQRQLLNGALFRINSLGELSLNTEQVEVLTGILNMLNAGSDQRTFAKNTTDSPKADFVEKPNRLAVVLEGGIVQCVVADQPQGLQAVVVDYDTDTLAESEITMVTQGDGSQSEAWVYDATPQKAAIDLNALYQEVYGDH